MGGAAPNVSELASAMFDDPGSPLLLWLINKQPFVHTLIHRQLRRTLPIVSFQALIP